MSSPPGGGTDDARLRMRARVSFTDKQYNRIRAEKQARDAVFRERAQTGDRASKERPYLGAVPVFPGAAPPPLPGAAISPQKHF